MIDWVGDKPAIYTLSELPGSQCEVHLRAQDLCILHCAFALCANLRCTAN